MAFELSDDLMASINELLPDGQTPPSDAVVTRYYDGSMLVEYEPALVEPPLVPQPALEGLKAFAGSARRLAAPTPEQEETTAATRNDLAQWATGWTDQLKSITDLRDDAGAKLLAKLKKESEGKSNPQTADMVEALQAAVEPLLDAASAGSAVPQIDELVEEALPVFVYFENYGVLDSAIYLPRFLEDKKREPTSARTRTVDAMFKHVALDAKEITDLGNEEALPQKQSGNQPSAAILAKDQRRKEERAASKAFALPKIAAGKDTQSDDDFCVVARIEAYIAGWDTREALRRASAYHAAGADAILIHSAWSTPAQILEFAREWADR